MEEVAVGRGGELEEGAEAEVGEEEGAEAAVGEGEGEGAEVWGMIACRRTGSTVCELLDALCNEKGK